MDVDEISTSQCDLDPAVFNARVRGKIDEYKLGHPGAFLSSTKLRPAERATLLTIIAMSHPESQALDQLIRKLQSLDSTGSNVQALQLHSKIATIYETGSFHDIYTLDNVMTSQAPLTAPGGGLPRSSSGSSLQSAFEADYLGHQHKLLIEILNGHWRAGTNAFDQKPYNLSISVIQSSGMGKSRMVEEAAKLVFTIPINVRENLPQGLYTYPPPDDRIRDYFLQPGSDTHLQALYTILLRELFRETTKKLKKSRFQGESGESLARKWADYLAEGRTEKKVGKRRRKLFKKVVDNSRAQLPSLEVTERNFNKLTKKMQAACQELVDTLSNNYSSDDIMCFVYFDEAHTLTEPPKNPKENHRRSRYRNLGKVLSNLIHCPVFFIFLSTNSHFQQFAPPPANHPSLRRDEGYLLYPPFTELPYDVFLEHVLGQLKEEELTLKNLCKTDIIVGFGRGLWYAHHRQWVKQEQDHVLEFARVKLGGRKPPDRFKPQLAAVGIRIGITFDQITQASRTMESELVESHMRVVHAIPEHQEYMHAGTPSEPILANAAAEYLHRCAGDEGIAVFIPRLLARAVSRDFLTSGAREETCGRTLVTISRDIALEQYFHTTRIIPSRFEPRFHQPVPVLMLLGAMFPEALYKKILGAKSMTRKAGVPSLEQAFANAFVSFSHFALAGDSEMLSAPNLVTALQRGMALQAKDDQVSIDAVIPIHMGPTDAPISPDTTSAINLQFKNRKRPELCYVQRRITVRNVEMPVISIVFEFGAEGYTGDRVQITQTPRQTRSSKRQKKTHANDHHYQIVAYGCGPDTFKAVPKEAEAHYKAILASTNIIKDFPRSDNPRCLQSLLNQKPFFEGKRSEPLLVNILEIDGVS